MTTAENQLLASIRKAEDSVGLNRVPITRWSHPNGSIYVPDFVAIDAGNSSILVAAHQQGSEVKFVTTVDAFLTTFTVSKQGKKL